MDGKPKHDGRSAIWLRGYLKRLRRADWHMEMIEKRLEGTDHPALKDAAENRKRIALEIEYAVKALKEIQ